MRFKTTKFSQDNMEMLRYKFGFENNAQILKFALCYSLKKRSEINLELVEDGFMIDIHTLFSEQITYFEFLFKQLYPEQCLRAVIISHIHNGIGLLIIYLRKNKNCEYSFLINEMEQ